MICSTGPHDIRISSFAPSRHCSAPQLTSFWAAARHYEVNEPTIFGRTRDGVCPSGAAWRGEPRENEDGAKAGLLRTAWCKSRQSGDKWFDRDVSSLWSFGRHRGIRGRGAFVETIGLRVLPVSGPLDLGFASTLRLASGNSRSHMRPRRMGAQGHHLRHHGPIQVSTGLSS